MIIVSVIRANFNEHAANCFFNLLETQSLLSIVCPQCTALNYGQLGAEYSSTPWFENVN